MNPTSLIVARYLATHAKPHSTVVDAEPRLHDVPTTSAITAFCHAEFGQVPTASLARNVRDTLAALAKGAA